MAQIISKIDTTIKIPPYFKGLSGKEWVVIEFKAEEPKEVSDKIGAYYTKNRPKIFRYAHDEIVPFYKPEEIEEPKKEFDALEFLETNYDNIEEAIKETNDRKNLFAICKFLKLGNYVSQNSERIKERILTDIKVKKEHDAKIENNSSTK